MSKIVEFEESDLVIKFDKMMNPIRYDKDGPGSNSDYCGRKQIDIACFDSQNFVFFEFKRIDWFKDFVNESQDVQQKIDDKVCDLVNCYLDSFSGLFLSGFIEFPWQENSQLKCILVVNTALQPDSWVFINDKLRKYLERKVKKLSKVRFTLLTESTPDIPKWLHIENRKYGIS